MSSMRNTSKSNDQEDQNRTPTLSSSKNDRLFENIRGNSLNYTLDRIEFINILLEDSDLEPMFTNKKITERECAGITDINQVFDKKTLNFVSALRKFGDNLIYVKSGTTGHTFKGISIPDSSRPEMVINFAIKVVAYTKDSEDDIKKGNGYGPITNPARPENAELMMLKVLSYFVIKRHTPHIILPITTFNAKIQTLIELERKGLIESRRFSDFVSAYYQDQFHENVSVVIEEWADGGDLLQFLRDNYRTLTTKQWRVIFFQVISTIAIIQSRYPSFRHNDLKANNILLQNITETSSDTTFINIIENIRFYVPNIGIRCKICDFDFACIPGIVENQKVELNWTSRINVKPEEHRYYDVHYFFNTLTKLFLKNFFSSDKDGLPFVPDEVTDFVKRVIPAQLRSGEFISKNGRLLLGQNKLNKLRYLLYKTPFEILEKDPFFAKMRQFDMDV